MTDKTRKRIAGEFFKLNDKMSGSDAMKKLKEKYDPDATDATFRRKIYRWAERFK